MASGRMTVNLAVGTSKLAKCPVIQVHGVTLIGALQEPRARGSGGFRAVTRNSLNKKEDFLKKFVNKL